MTRSADVYISYNRSDANDYALRIERELTMRGVTVFMDTDLIPGRPIQTSLEEGIERSKIIVLLLSRSASESPWLRNELAVAIRQNKYVLPVILHPAARESAMLSLFADRQFLDATDIPLSEATDRVVQSVVRMLAREVDVGYLFQREKRIQARRRHFLLTSAALALCAILFSVTAIWTWSGRRSTRDARVLSFSTAATLRENGGAPRDSLVGVALLNVDLSRLDFRDSDFSDAILLGSDLSAVLLDKARFVRTYLNGSRLSRANAVGADFSQAHMIDCDLTNAIFSKASLETADLRFANLTNADLTDANLAGTDLRSATTDGARFDRARYDDKTLFPDSEFDPKLRGMVHDGESRTRDGRS